MSSQLAWKATIISIAAAFFFAAGCSKPVQKPQPVRLTAADLDKILHGPKVDLSQLPQIKEDVPNPNDPAQMKAITIKLLADFAEHLNHVPPIPPPPSAATYASANHPPDAAARASASTTAPVYVASLEELTELIRKSGFDPHPADLGMIPYFDALPGPSGSYDEVGIPGKLRMFYFLMENNKVIYFIVPIRTTRSAEEPDLTGEQFFDASRSGDADNLYAPDLISKLKAANPLARTTQFAVRSLPIGLRDGVQVFQPTIVVGGGFHNPSSDPDVITSAVAEMIMVLHATKDIWQ